MKLNRILIALILTITSNIVDGQLSFETALLTNKTETPVMSEIADLNGDGLQDVITASRSDGKIAWYKNEGNGNLGFQRIIHEAGYTQFNVDDLTFIKVLDIDNDSDNDILYCCSNRIAWIKNLGDGVFVNGGFISNNPANNSTIGTTDFDNDGDVDLLFSGLNENNTYSLFWHENNGLGEFSIMTELFNGVHSSIPTADFNNDGLIDVLRIQSSSIVRYQNNGDGTFNYNSVSNSDMEDFQLVVLEDINNDGNVDVVFNSPDDNKLGWFENLGNGYFGDVQFIATGISNPIAYTAIDIDNDGDIDFACKNGTFVDVFLNDGMGEFQISFPSYIPVNFVVHMTSGDLNDDGFLDIVTGSSTISINYINPDEFSWFQNNQENVFSVEKKISSSAIDVDDLYAVDIDSDGDLDVLSASSQDYKIAWYENMGDNNFLTQKVLGEMQGAWSVYALDVNGDNLKDVIASTSSSIIWFENLGGGIFSTLQEVTSEVQFSKSVYAIDLDGDNDNDIISASYGDDKIAWYQNDGNGNFGSQQVIANVNEAWKVFAIDLDNDGDNDVLSSSFTYGSSVAWHENDGNGNFESFVIESIQYVRDVDAADIDGDGDLDILAISQNAGELFWFENLGGGIFGELTMITTELNFVRSIDTNDFDNDGDLDIVIVSNLQTGVFLNNGSGEFADIMTITSGGYTVFSIDIDIDGDIDIITGAYNNGKITLLENSTGEGCTDSSACNYNISAQFDDGSCCFGICGCFDPNAVNFEPNATCEIDCQYSAQGFVYFDQDENGVFDGTDYGLPFQEIVSSEGMSFFTNNEGFFFPLMSQNETTFNIVSNDLFPFNTTDSAFTFINAVNQSTLENSAYFGVSSEEPIFDLELAIYPSGQSFLCDEYLSFDLCIRNISNEIITGVFEFEYDNLYQGFEEVSPIDSINDNILYYSYDSLVPNEMVCYSVLLQTPTAAYLGEELVSSGRGFGYFYNELVSTELSFLSQEVLCSYDPNDKQVFPEGQLDDHFVLTNTELEYLIRFQNTGNAPAVNVLITDAIDENMDINTFSLVANSHNVNINIKIDEGVIEFLFENIMLPDSTNNEPNSHGFISYKMSPLDNLEYGTEVNNTANIYFDNNPPITTNTTWTTFYNCENFIAEISSDNLELVSEQLGTYQWYLNGNIIDEATSQSYTALENGNYSVEVINELGCISLSDEIVINVVGVDELSNTNIQLFPNPMQESSTLYFAESGINYHVKLFDAEGRLIRDYGLVTDGQLEIHRKDLSSGNYLVEVISMDKREKFGIQLLVE